VPSLLSLEKVRKRKLVPFAVTPWKELLLNLHPFGMPNYISYNKKHIRNSFIFVLAFYILFDKIQGVTGLYPKYLAPQALTISL